MLLCITQRRFYSPTTYKKVTHCLFDMDGTVLDSEYLYHKIIADICEQNGATYTKDMKVRLYGVTERQICEALVKELKLKISVDECERQLKEKSERMMPSAPIMKGAERLLTHFFDHKVPMALATNSTEQAVRLQAVARPKLFAMFHHKVSVCDPEVKVGKPDPTIYLVAASRFPDKPKPEKCLVFEDTAVGVRAAVDAGMQVVMTPDPRLEREQTRHATLVIRSLLEFRPELFGLAPFDDRPEEPKRRIQLEDDPDKKETEKEMIILNSARTPPKKESN
ncbi:probable pseudouridine-5'-phosphatase [Plodia interpunctella]|uniref:probable pseudouridine-5'-phosphatase n=1 Tax=Plodia interpunctella TaxID=58824 RepID=UPI002367F36F|nr:probable pseudouridine-5'-phosphatase [Plodia interpunctella]